MYSKLFEFVLGRINFEIAVSEKSLVSAEIGVLDIFGFESFQTNSLEQLCINYAVRFVRYVTSLKHDTVERGITTAI